MQPAFRPSVCLICTYAYITSVLLSVRQASICLAVRLANVRPPGSFPFCLSPGPSACVRFLWSNCFQPVWPSSALPIPCQWLKSIFLVRLASSLAHITVRPSSWSVLPAHWLIVRPFSRSALPACWLTVRPSSRSVIRARWIIVCLFSRCAIPACWLTVRPTSRSVLPAHLLIHPSSRSVLPACWLTVHISVLLVHPTGLLACSTSFWLIGLQYICPPDPSFRLIGVQYIRSPDPSFWLVGLQYVRPTRPISLFLLIPNPCCSTIYIYMLHPLHIPSVMCVCFYFLYIDANNTRLYPLLNPISVSTPGEYLSPTERVRERERVGE